LKIAGVWYMDIGFFIKKLVTFFIEPYGIVLSLLILGIYFLFTDRENKAKLSLLLSAILLSLFAYPPISNMLIKGLEDGHSRYAYKEKIRYIHVLGSGHKVDREQPLSSQIGSASIKRVIEGIVIHKKIKNSKLIFTGYEGITDIPNATVNANLAILLGVKKSDIIEGIKPKDTKEEAIFVERIVGDEPFVLVTSATHMSRALAIFHSIGLYPIPAPTNFHKKKSITFLSLPNENSLLLSKIAIHEYIGALWSKIVDFIK
jgi:uncharacterized SAM-binding protein YcdF (DUF218 family)